MRCGHWGRFKGKCKNPIKPEYLWRLFGDSCIMVYPIPLILGWVASESVFPVYQTPTLRMRSLHVTSRSRMFLLYRLAPQSLPTNVGKSITRKAFRTLTLTAGPAFFERINCATVTLPPAPCPLPTSPRHCVG